MDFISKGGYAEVFYDNENRDIYRRLPRINNTTKQLDISSFNDLIFTKSFEYTNYTPIIYKEKISKKHISFHMPYYGETLHHWVRNNSLETRNKYAAYILLQIVTGCIYLHKNAFFHSDIKPSNIMIETIYEECPEKLDTNDTTVNNEHKGTYVDLADDENDNDEEDDEDDREHEKKMKNVQRQRQIKDIVVRIIDFNISSIKVLWSDDIKMGWSYTIGTWNYSSPEIILYETPHNNSISWNIGTIAAFIIDEYPFIDHISEDMDRVLVKQDVWIKTMNDLYLEFPDHPPLSRKELYGTKWAKLIDSCTEWNNLDRWSIREIHAYIYSDLLCEEYKLFPTIVSPSCINTISPIEYKIEIVKINLEKRKELINMLYYFCKKMENMNIFPTAVAIFDRCLLPMNEKFLENIDYIIAGSVILSCFINNYEILLSDRDMSCLFSSFDCSNHMDVMLYMYYIGELLNWKLWEKPAHIIIIEQEEYLRCNIELFEYIRDAFILQQGKYTQNDIAIQVIDQIKENETRINQFEQYIESL